MERSYDDKFPFVYAAELGLASTVFQLLDREPKVAVKDKKTGKLVEDRKLLKKAFLDGALIANCRGETDPELVQRLLAEGASVNAVDEENNTALHYAACAPADKAAGKFLWTQRSHAIKVLMDAGADLDVLNEEELTPLLKACETFNEKGAFLIAAKGADLNCVEKWMTKHNKIGLEQKKDGKKNRAGEITWVVGDYGGGRGGWWWWWWGGGKGRGRGVPKMVCGRAPAHLLSARGRSCRYSSRRSPVGLFTTRAHTPTRRCPLLRRCQLIDLSAA